MAHPRKDPHFGEGSVYRVGTGRHAGRWVAVLLVYTEGNLRARPVPCYGADPATAQLARARRRADLAAERTPTRETVAAFLDRWIGDQARWSDATRDYTRTRLLPHLLPALGAIRVAELTARQVRAWLAGERAAGAGEPVLRNAFLLLRAACARGVEDSELARNPCLGRDTPRRPVHGPDEARALDAGEARALLDAATSSRHYPLILLLLMQGLRIGEALGLRWQEVTLDTAHGTGQLTIRHALSGRAGGQYALIAPKTPNARRAAALVEPLVTTLAAWRTRQKRERLRAGAGWQETIPDLVFTTQTGRPYGRQAIRRALLTLCTRAGVPPMSPHDLRRTWATLQAEAGSHPAALRDGLGHSSTAMALQYVQRTAQGPALAARMAGILGLNGAQALAPRTSIGDNEDDGEGSTGTK